MKLSGPIVVLLCVFCSFTEGAVTISADSGTTLSVGENFVFSCMSDLPGTDLFFGPQAGRLNPNPPSGQAIQFNVTSVTSADNGLEFFCRDDDGTMTITLIVMFPPNYTNSTDDQELDKGDSLSLVFNLEAQPIMGDNFTYTWTKNEVQFTSGSNVAVTATSISITSADCSDNGLYNVTATNPLGSDSVSFRLTVLCPPIFEADSSPRRIIVTAGQDFTINCRVNESYPLNPTITLTAPGNVTDVTANPSQVFRQDQVGTYTYVCSANNTRATADFMYVVSVGGAMSPTSPSTDPPTRTPSPTSAAPNIGPSIGLIIGVVVGVSVLALVISILVPVLICCCLGVGVFATIGCLAKNKKKDDIEIAKL